MNLPRDHVVTSLVSIHSVLKLKGNFKKMRVCVCICVGKRKKMKRTTMSALLSEVIS